VIGRGIHQDDHGSIPQQMSDYIQGDIGRTAEVGVVKHMRNIKSTVAVREKSDGGDGVIRPVDDNAALNARAGFNLNHAFGYIEQLIRYRGSAAYQE